jgi:hypothetical protein
MAIAGTAKKEKPKNSPLMPTTVMDLRWARRFETLPGWLHLLILTA